MPRIYRRKKTSRLYRPVIPTPEQERIRILRQALHRLRNRIKYELLNPRRPRVIDQKFVGCLIREVDKSADEALALTGGIIYPGL